MNIPKYGIPYRTIRYWIGQGRSLRLYSGWPSAGYQQKRDRRQITASYAKYLQDYLLAPQADGSEPTGQKITERWLLLVGATEYEEGLLWAILNAPAK